MRMKKKKNIYINILKNIEFLFVDIFCVNNTSYSAILSTLLLYIHLSLERFIKCILIFIF